MQRDTGYRGIWYHVGAIDSEYKYKYSGGLGTYCAKHIPMAVYAPEVDKTFFAWGGSKPTERALLEMVSYYDHKTNQVPRPVILMDKQTDDAHDNPVLSLDDEGYLWVFLSAHGTGRPAYIFRSNMPYSINGFEQVSDFNYSYPQPWFIPGEGFLFLHTFYKGGRGLYFMTSPDGRNWSERQMLAHVDEGHYQVSWPRGKKVGTAFNYHPAGTPAAGLDYRTNLYYLETEDMGRTWTTAAGDPVDLPIQTVHNPALVHDYQSEGLLAYMKAVNYDAQGRPIILFVTGPTYLPGPHEVPRTWRVAHWTGKAWAIHTVTESDNNYDTGALYVDPDGVWRVVGPTETGPQPYNPGGEIAVWESADQGRTWARVEQLTHDSPFNHTYARQPLGADPQFYTYWADGHGREPSVSRLYFYNRESGQVMRLPYVMDRPMMQPEVVESRD